MASTGEVWKLGHRPALDGVRGIAVLLVVIAHAGVPGFEAAGNVGVTVFFTLSGFLITTLLLEEQVARGRVGLVGFYRRRALRLLPALFAFLAVMVAAATVVAGLVPRGVDAVAVLLYFGNWVTALTGYHLGGINHTWSLAIEEQFYLAWPLLLVVVRRRSVLALVAALGVVWAVVGRALLWDGGAGGDRVYYGTDMHADGLLVGCLLALWLHGRVAPRMSVWAPGLALAFLLVLGFSSGTFEFVWLPALVPAATVVVLLVAVGPTAPGWLLSRPVREVGKRAYGLYLWHYPLVWLLPDAVSWWTVPLGLAVTCVAVEVSWRFVEQPFLRRKDRVASARVPVAV